jgi:transcriptional regulator with XRE-family HTH domain
MKKELAKELDDDLRPEYDLSLLKGGVRGKYYNQATAGTNVVFLDPDVAKASTGVGKRLRQLREFKGLSQGDIERRSGLLRSYISRVEGGYTAPSLATLEKFARALEVEPYQLLFQGEGKPSAPTVPDQLNLGKPVKRLIKFFENMSSTRRRLLVSMADTLAKH